MRFPSGPPHPETIIHKQRLQTFMKVFDGKKAATEYMSKHTLAFSTPELTLMRFATIRNSSSYTLTA